MKSRSYLKLHQVESETRSLGQVLEKASIHSRSTVLILLAFICQNVYPLKTKKTGILQSLRNKTTLICINIGTPKAVNFPFVPDRRLIILGVPIIRHIRVVLFLKD